MDVKVVIGFQPYHVDLKRISNHNIMYLVLKKERYRRRFFFLFLFSAGTAKFERFSNFPGSVERNGILFLWNRR